MRKEMMKGLEEHRECSNWMRRKREEMNYRAVYPLIDQVSECRRGRREGGSGVGEETEGGGGRGLGREGGRRQMDE